MHSITLFVLLPTPLLAGLKELTLGTHPAGMGTVVASLYPFKDLFGHVEEPDFILLCPFSPQFLYPDLFALDEVDHLKRWFLAVYHLVSMAVGSQL